MSSRNHWRSDIRKYVCAMVTDLAQSRRVIKTVLNAHALQRRFAEALNGLFSPSKRPRIYTPLSSAIPSLIPSTAPLPTLPPPTTYAPFSPLPLLSRLRTFRPSTFTPSFPPLTPLELALSGWTNTAREEVGCGSCGAKYGVGGLGEIVDASVRKEVARRLGKKIEEGHGKGCAWRVRRSPSEWTRPGWNCVERACSGHMA